jgi:hypothetical protein
MRSLKGFAPSCQACQDVVQWTRRGAPRSLAEFLVALAIWRNPKSLDGHDAGQKLIYLSI